MNFKKILRLLVLILIIAMASIVPVPITFKSRDNLPKHLIEQIDNKENDDESEDIKELF